MFEQIPLPFSLNPELGFPQFHPGANGELLQHLQRSVRGAGEHLIFLWGNPGVGKTHLLQGCCSESAQNQRTPAYIPLREHRRLDPDMLEGLEQLGLICLDDLDAISGNRPWELALFRLFNRIREEGRILIAAAENPPAQLGLTLPDLASRLSWGLTLRVHPLEGEEEIIQALELRAKSYGFALPAQTIRFLMVRYHRDLSALLKLLEKLDRASLAAQRKLTIPFVKTLIEEMQNAPPLENSNR